MTQLHQERPYEDDICAHLEANGWLYSPNDAGYDRARALFPEDLFAWLKDANPQGYEKVFGPDDAPLVDKRIKALDRLKAELEKDAYQHGGGTLNVLRNGLDIVGVKRFPLVQPQPADLLNPATQALYAKNRLRVMRQVYYSRQSTNSIDLVLFCNGLPVATLELKANTTQSIEAAIAQYRNDRDPKNEPLLTPIRGALVHFAVSSADVFMTTTLAGKGTRFLPFNRGHENGAGNPPVPGDVPASYLWREIFERDTWIGILTKFIYFKHETRTDPITHETTTTTSVRFPRYHQWRAVTNLVVAARTEGSGRSYLVQHSAGSGKTDSIAWLAHRLASLHADDGIKVFDGVIVIADRQVLDKQLRQAIGQLETTTGTFQAITAGGSSKSKKLAEALLERKPIIGVTLQTFPEALGKIQEAGGLDGRRYAIIADEAHSSQSGDATAKLRVALNLRADDDREVGDEEDALRVMADRANEDGRLSFFAFTATPKEKTLQLFGRRPAGAGEDAKPEPFDLYAMKQAIEEGFILDVLSNYSEWKMLARLETTAGEEMDVDKGSGRMAYKKFVLENPTTIHEKARVIVEHFDANVKTLLGGRAKAMVVTSSRQDALRFKYAFDLVVEEKELPFQALVAFSGDVADPNSETTPPSQVSEAQANPDARGKALDEAFKRDEFKVMIVAEKFQTGFDQPLLCAMYVDKELSGITAVQTLSRLNRVIDGKTTTYVVDFRNDPAKIQEAFQEYYEDAQVLTEADEYLVVNLRKKLEQALIFNWSEIDAFYAAWTRTGRAAKHTEVISWLGPASERWETAWRQAAFDGDKKRADELRDFKSAAAQYVRVYDFFSQFINYGDAAYEKLAAFMRLLSRMLVETSTGEQVDVSDAVMTHFRLEELKVHNSSLTPGKAKGLQGMTAAGMAKQREKELASRHDVVEYVNELFEGSQLDETDKVSTAEALMRKVADDHGLQVEAQANAFVDFRHSSTLRTVVEDALWTTPEGVAQGAAHLRDVPIDTIIRVLLKMGLHEELKSAAS